MSDVAFRTIERVLLFDRSARLRMHFTGPKAAESLTGLVTNDVLSLRGGDGQYACALTPKGRVIADVRILCLADADGAMNAFTVDANAAAGVAFSAMIRKYMNPRLAKYTDVSATTACLTLAGTEAIALLQRCGAEAAVLDDLRVGPSFTHRVTSVGDIAVRIARVPDLGDIDVFDLHCDRAQCEALLAALVAAGADHADDGEWRRRRVVAGRPEWGVDMDEHTLAQEANMDALQAISYTKGCYTGQETVARVHFRGHVNRTLRRVRFGDTVLPDTGTALNDEASAVVGDVRSGAMNDDAQLVGIAMLRREVGDGARLSWSGVDGIAHTVIAVGAPDGD